MVLLMKIAVLQYACDINDNVNIRYQKQINEAVPVELTNRKDHSPTGI